MKFPQLPQPPPSYLNQGTNNLIIQETNYDIDEMSMLGLEAIVEGGGLNTIVTK